MYIITIITEHDQVQQVINSFQTAIELLKESKIIRLFVRQGDHTILNYQRR